MKFTGFVFITFAALLLGGVAARAGDVLVVDPQPGVHPKLLITVPAGWAGRMGVVAKPNGTPVVIITKTVGGKITGDMALRFIWETGMPAEEDKVMSGWLTDANDDSPKGQDTPRLKLTGKWGHGIYSSFAKNREEQSPPSLRWETQGLYCMGRWLVTFGVSGSGPKSAELRQALKFVREGIAVEAKTPLRDEAQVQAVCDVADLEDQLAQAKPQVVKVKAEITGLRAKVAAGYEDDFDQGGRLEDQLKEYEDLVALLQTKLEAAKTAAK